MIAAQEKKHTELETLCEEASAELERNAELMANVSQLYEELISFADLYDSASFEAKDDRQPAYPQGRRLSRIPNPCRLQL